MLNVVSVFYRAEFELPVMLEKKQTVDYLFTSCVILHNIKLSADGRDNLWGKNVKWSGSDGDHDLDDDEWNFHNEKRQILFRWALQKLTDYSSVGRRFSIQKQYSDDDDFEQDQAFLIFVNR